MPIPMALIDDGVHSEFQFNGSSYTAKGLKEKAADLINNGRAFERPIGEFLVQWLNASSTIAVETSGSTGKPKRILLQKTHMVNSARATGRFFDLKEGDTALLCLPVTYIAGKMMLVRALVLGLKLHCVEPTTNPMVGLSETYDFVAMVPLQLENSLAKIESIKTLIVGGAAISKALNEKIQAKATAIYETYGMTETITHVAVRKVGRDPVKAHADQYFTALPKVSFSLDDRGCLVISAPDVGADPVVTNDMVKLISATAFQWLGRYDNVINSGGVKFFPERIEAKLADYIDSRFFVAAMADEKLGQKVILVIEGVRNTKRLLEQLKEKAPLDRFEMPKEIVAIAEFNETETGKIQRGKTLQRLTT